MWHINRKIRSCFSLLSTLGIIPKSTNGTPRGCTGGPGSGKLSRRAWEAARAPQQGRCEHARCPPDNDSSPTEAPAPLGFYGPLGRPPSPRGKPERPRYFRWLSKALKTQTCPVLVIVGLPGSAGKAKCAPCPVPAVRSSPGALTEV